MGELTIKVSNQDRRMWLYALRKKYNKKRFGLARLVRLAVKEAVVSQLRIDVEIAEERLDD